MDDLLKALKMDSCLNQRKQRAKPKTPRAAGGKLLTCELTTNTVIQTVTFSMNTLNFANLQFIVLLPQER